jgi:hypothetical protein
MPPLCAVAGLEVAVMDELRRHFRPEFLNRVDEMPADSSLAVDRDQPPPACRRCSALPGPGPPALPTHTGAPPTPQPREHDFADPLSRQACRKTSILDVKVCGDVPRSTRPPSDGASGRCSRFADPDGMSGCSGSRYAPLDQIGPYAMSRYIAGSFLSYYEMRQNNHRLWHADLRAGDAAYLPAHKGCASTRAWRTRR